MSILSTLPTEDERDLLDQAARWPGFASCADLTAEAVRQFAAREGIDLATALLYDRVVRSPVHGPFLKKLQALTEPPPGAAAASVVIVPGAFYREFAHTGADGRAVRTEAEALGFATDLVPLVSLGSLRTNARILCDWLAGDRRENLVLVSLSKGGADVKMALAEPGAAKLFRKVAFWINLSGLLHGTPLVAWLFSRRLRTPVGPVAVLVARLRLFGPPGAGARPGHAAGGESPPPRSLAGDPRCWLPPVLPPEQSAGSALFQAGAGAGAQRRCRHPPGRRVSTAGPPLARVGCRSLPAAGRA